MHNLTSKPLSMAALIMSPKLTEEEREFLQAKDVLTAVLSERLKGTLEANGKLENEKDKLNEKLEAKEKEKDKLNEKLMAKEKLLINDWA